MHWLKGILLSCLLLTAACGGTQPAAKSSPPSTPPHLFLIVMENHGADQVMNGRYISSLAARYGVAANYHAIAHPSVPNYLALSSGSTWGVRDDSYYVLPQRDLGTQLTNSRLTWRAYMEGLTSDGCLDSPVPYDPGHNPFAYYGGRCPSNVVPLSSFSTDLATSTPRFSWISPDRCHDMHDCSVATGDAWLRQEVPQIMASSAWKSNGALFITWDEDEGSTENSVLTLVIRPGAKHVVSDRLYTHYSLLATIEDVLGVSRLGEAAQATPMTDLMKP